MRNRVIELLHPKPGEVYVDATAGLGGHAAWCARKLSDSGKTSGIVVLNDLDPANLIQAKANVEGAGPGVVVHVVQGNFAALPHALVKLNIKADMLVVDLGFASTQIDDASRGFSFGKDGPLDMRYSSSAPMSAADIVNLMSEAELARIIWEFGEEKQSRVIARKIVLTRALRPIERTSQLADLVRSVVRRTPGGIDPATRTFQALRIAVNDELGCLEALLAGVVDDARRAAKGSETRWLKPGARVVMIAFHSLEDRRVKGAFVTGGKSGEFVRAAMTGKGDELATGLDVDEVAVPTQEEIDENPRARSAKMRAVCLKS